MNVHKVTLCILDFENYGEDELRHYLQRTPGCDVIRFESRDIGEWPGDDHPLNKRDTFDAEFKRLFDEDK